VECRRPWAFIGFGSTRSAAPVRQLALKNLNFCEEIRFLLGGRISELLAPTVDIGNHTTNR
jgi:hypothetical protein